MEHKKHSLVYNVIMNAIVMTSAFIFPLLTVPYISRVLLEYGNGVVSFAQNFAYYFAVIASMGVANYGVVVCSSVRDNKPLFSQNVVEILIVLIAASLSLSVVYIIAVLLLPRFSDERDLYIFMVTSIWTTAFSLEWFFQSIEQYDYITIRALLVRTIGTICIFVFVRDKDDYLLYAAITVVAQGVSSLINILRMLKMIDRVEIRELSPQKHIKPMLSYLVMNVSKGMTNKSDILVLGFMGTAQMVGVYQIASKVENMIVAAVESVGSVLLPRMSSYKANSSNERYTDLLAFGVDFAVIIGCMALGGTVLCARPIVGILGGEAYEGAVAPLVATAPAILFAACTNVVSQSLLINGKERAFAMINLIGFATSVGSAVILIPRIGITGSGLAVTIGQFAVLASTVFLARHLLQRSFARVDLWKIVFSGVIAFLAGLAVGFCVERVNDVLKLLLVGGVFALSYIAVLFVSKERLILALWSRFMPSVEER